MNLLTLADLCRKLPAATEDVKWGDDLVVNKLTKKARAALGL
jgi:predicted DNA-binding protein (MmcQ/YjbR family)